MTPLQMVANECANWNQGACAGARFANDLSPLPGHPLDKCVLAVGKRCKYFEDCVLPMVNWITEPRKAKAFQEAAEIYHNLHKLQGAETKIRICPGCGGELLPRKRYCLSCVIKRRKTNNRQHQAKWRSGSKQLSPQSVVIP